MRTLASLRQNTSTSLSSGRLIQRNPSQANKVTSQEAARIGRAARYNATTDGLIRGFPGLAGGCADLLCFALHCETFRPLVATGARNAVRRVIVAHWMVKYTNRPTGTALKRVHHFVTPRNLPPFAQTHLFAPIVCSHLSATLSITRWAFPMEIRRVHFGPLCLVAK